MISGNLCVNTYNSVLFKYNVRYKKMVQHYPWEIKKIFFINEAFIRDFPVPCTVTNSTYYDSKFSQFGKYLTIIDIISNTLV